MREIRIPQLVPSVTLNSRGHWATKARRIKRERGEVAKVLVALRPPRLPIVVTLVRCSPRKLDGDNLAGAMKSVRDEVASWLGVDDGDEAAVTWRVEQQKAARAQQGTLLRIEAR